MENTLASMMSKIKMVVKQTGPNAIAILYGSRATGKARPDSDWDVLILLDQSPVPLKNEIQFLNDLYDLELETGERISPFVYAKKDWDRKLTVTPLYQDVKQYGIVL